jgi:hypothetical protein
MGGFLLQLGPAMYILQGMLLRIKKQTKVLHQSIEQGWWQSSTAWINRIQACHVEIMYLWENLSHIHEGVCPQLGSLEQVSKQEVAIQCTLQLHSLCECPCIMTPCSWVVCGNLHSSARHSKHGWLKFFCSLVWSSCVKSSLSAPQASRQTDHLECEASSTSCLRSKSPPRYTCPADHVCRIDNYLLPVHCMIHLNGIYPPHINWWFHWMYNPNDLGNCSSWVMTALYSSTKRTHSIYVNVINPGEEPG